MLVPGGGLSRKMICVRSRLLTFTVSVKERVRLAWVKSIWKETNLGWIISKPNCDTWRALSGGMGTTGL